VLNCGFFFQPVEPALLDLSRLWAAAGHFPGATYITTPRHET
jgi:hypothetical protein